MVLQYAQLLKSVHQRIRKKILDYRRTAPLSHVSSILTASLSQPIPNSFEPARHAYIEPAGPSLFYSDGTIMNAHWISHIHVEKLWGDKTIAFPLYEDTNVIIGPNASGK